jgi:SAM-dependent methyltransferase
MPQLRRYSAQLWTFSAGRFIRRLPPRRSDEHLQNKVRHQQQFLRRVRTDLNNSLTNESEVRAFGNSYFEVYDTFLSPFVGSRCGSWRLASTAAAAPKCGADYFGPRAHVTGIDIQPACMAYARDGVEIIIGNQGSPEFWDHIRATKEPFDVVIDDGSHDPQHQATTLKGILSHINPGGVYLCEDIQGHPRSAR